MRYKHFTTPIFALALAGAVQAAELGDIAPRSYIGQPLAVDIDLVSLTPEEANGLQVRLAAQDVYRGANVTMNPALASVRMQVERRGGKPVLHVTTARAVEADYLHLYVELGVPGKQEVRLATVWLQRDPNPPPTPVPAAPVAPAVPLASAMTPAQAEQITAQARAARAAAAAKSATGAPTGPGAAPAATTSAAGTASAAGGTAAAAPVRDRSKPAPLPSVHEAETGVPGEVKAAGQARRIAGVLVSPDGKPLKPSAREDTAEVPVGVSQALLPLAPLPLPKGVKRPASASCPAGGISAKECVALDNHNAEISTKLTELEGKLKTLQGALGGAVPTAKSAAPAAAHGDGAANPATAKAAPGAAAAPIAKPPASGAAEKTIAAASAPGAAGRSAVSGEVPAAAAKSSAAGGPGNGAASASSGATQGGKGAAQLSASMAAQGETEMHAAKAAAGEAGASASASAGADASAAASVPTKQVRVLPKLKYKKEKEKPVEQTSSTWPLVAGGVGLLALLGGGFFFWRKKNAGRGPLKIWQGFRKKKVEDPMEEFKPVPEPAAASSSS
ncbi:pilus assembly protein FimV [Duganella sp. SG902]|uniref:type IV pilus assembly protein FimV n=1 Tax=Duganella sp. SG902 TaxID=2587016 RepID=UPI00159D0EF9|nr:LPXTG cell wall anchor domain-containing protein [Duganella sp. SG902]NVM76606.1 pilus assembly protein FimV [Duganella sp. SG902]